jgi:prophage tail gpP-like protein
MSDPRITDNDAGTITATVNGKEIRGWSYMTDAERRIKMLMAHEFAEGWFQARTPKQERTQ